MSKVIQVVREFHFGLRDVGSVMRVPVVPYLRPAGKTRCYEVAGVVVRNTGAVLSRERGQLGTRSDERKVPAQYVPQLRKFIESQNAEPVADARHRQLGFAADRKSTRLNSSHS